jgi:GSH-dependent disulfide-bond oxidoreductase
MADLSAFPITRRWPAARPDRIQLYSVPTPNGVKVSIALEEMGLPYTLHPVDIGRGEQFRPEFLRISPNNRMPAIVDPEGPDGAPISVFESGAILRYLADKTGRFGGEGARGRVEVDEWLFWQVGGLGPMAGQAHHFRQYAPALAPDARTTAYGAIRYTNEAHRLYGVMDRRLADREYLAGAYSIADMAAWPWVVPHAMQGIELGEFPHLGAWFERVGAREAVRRGRALGEELRRPVQRTGADAERERALLFGQRARR